MMVQEDHLDIAALQDLKEIMEDEYETLVNTFILDSQNKIDAIGPAISRGDAEELRKLAHSIKGSSSNVCAFQFSEFARQLEAMGKDNSLSNAEKVYDNLITEFAIVTSILNSSL